VKKIFLIAALALAPLPAAATTLPSFSDLLIFGDSLSDPGNAFNLVFGAPVSPAQGIFDNGQITDGDAWATQLGADFASGTNFAYAAARTQTAGTLDLEFPGGVTVPYDADDLPEQIAAFVAAKTTGALTLGANPLAAVFIGGNDFRDAFAEPDPAAAVQAAIPTVIGDIIAAVGTLQAQGIGQIVVMGLPDLGRIPETLDSGIDASRAATGASVAFNAALRTALATPIPGVLPDVSGLSYFDTFGLFAEVLATPQAFGFDPALLGTPCLDALLAMAVSDCTGYLFYDSIHPTEAAHALIAARFAEQVAPIPLPAGVILMLSGLGALGAMRYRARRT
jgi:phospholipase/lecithinase/hemolysin